jgi:hypothetical protein
VLVPRIIQAQLYTRAVNWIANDSDPLVFAAQVYDAAQGKITVREALSLYKVSVYSTTPMCCTR